MGLALKVAWRNLWRHKRKSLVIGIILFCGAALMTVGNGMISGLEQGLSENIVNLFTGDIVVVSDSQIKNDVLFDMMSGKPLKVIKNYEAAQQFLQKVGLIDQFVPATAGFVMILNPESEMGQVWLLGVDIDRYRKMFPGSFSVTEGRLLAPGERGVMISEEARKQSFNRMGFWILPTDGKLDQSKLPPTALNHIENLDIRKDIVFMGASNTNSNVDVRVPVTGIINYKALNRIWGYYCIVDIESFREAHNYISGAENKVELSGEEKKLMDNDNLDQLFSSGSVIKQTQISSESFKVQDIQKETRKDAKKYNTDSGSYNLVFLKLKKGVSQEQALAKLNQAFKDNNLGVRAISWKDAVGTFGSIAMMVKGALGMFIMFIFFVAIIVIMNTLSMATLERVSELGMMRAIGARRSFLRKMFVYETGLLSFLFGGLGIIVGIIIIYLIKATGISTTNEMLQLVYGGDKLNPIVTMGDLIFGIFELGIVTLLAVLYPLRVVSKIVPLDAVTRD